jgi:cytochrome c556
MLSRATLLFFAVLTGGAATASEEGEDHDLIGLMGQMQYFSHKLDLSIRHRNRELVDFYAHEIEETLEATTEIAEYHGKPVGQLTESMLAPAFERFEQAVDAENGDWDAIDASFDGLVDTCNACHQATDYGFINIQRTDVNPYMQSFSTDNP